MLYRREFATLGDAAFVLAPFRAPLLPHRIRACQTGRGILHPTHHRPALRKAAGGSAQSFDMIAVQPAGSLREISRPPRFKKGG